MAWIQLEAGTSAGIFDETQTDLDYLQDDRLPGIRRFLKTVEAEIKSIDVDSPETYRRDDVNLMEYFREQGLSTPDFSPPS